MEKKLVEVAGPGPRQVCQEPRPACRDQSRNQTLRSQGVGRDGLHLEAKRQRKQDGKAKIEYVGPDERGPALKCEPQTAEKKIAFERHQKNLLVNSRLESSEPESETAARPGAGPHHRGYTSHVAS